ncbi:hypothetical protein [Denitrobaculum tricleocarpae]|uniref:Uncharacterized protein n=1 Tax=Denitrobaculum tricleocarpae TaxID=2591009 RepID=A0A545TSY6_9PROT|nr:hypothetical protein [Denitrobaculum tricleocarpae]TQV80330.1 hypothetical protein FKG95_09045 [Denitrobaculum tricleocarpae]
MNTEPLDIQEHHSPTEPVTVEQGTGRGISKTETRQRSSEKQVMDALAEADVLQLAMTLRRGWMLHGGANIQAQDHSRQRFGMPSEFMSKSDMIVYRTYKEWRQRCKAEHVSIGPLYDVWFCGHGMKKVARWYKVRDSRVIDLMIEALEA